MRFAGALMNLETVATFGDSGRPVMKIVPSPRGQFLALIYGEGRTWNSNRVQGAALFRREADSYVLVGELTSAGEDLFVLDDGHCAVVRAEYDKIEMIRYRIQGSSLAEEAARFEFRGLDLFKPSLAWLPPGKELFMQVMDRDDGQGWSDPVYTNYWRHIDIASGKVLSEQKMDLPHFYPALGRPFVSQWVGGDRQKLQAIIKALPFRREWAHRVGPKCLLTSSRVIDVLSGATLLGQEQTEAGVHRVFQDLSEDEQWAVSISTEENLELWNVAGKTMAAFDLSELGGGRCAVFLEGREMVVGTGSGQAVLLRR